ncbi:HlyD family efflux transporter periplasmic adaptor subunit [Hymenobacter cheonanensis]|uniref:HlyD family efflux transporter periplasmic adaptor subunit n=1 Tax=Hymenobacter sp. CA2-7 TaxID=3063993 RepID=UPI0027125D55|nr:HlyD family efflux transporter periplasmic adaptor subunit [Hymenobacter sp. CA2-7]MDO7884246.1 HlyD family efflux transporter periplasmic adaptor subunit [Hymenobacter sp. CA2-7]
MPFAQEFTDLQSEEMQELMARPPQWQLRWGITILFLLLLLVAASAWTIRYPDLVRASFKLTAINAPKPVLARTEGKIVQLLAREGQVVESAAPLAYLESTASHDEIRQLMQELTAAWKVAQHGDLEGLRSLNLSGYHQLGELQSAYQTFEQAHIQLRAYLAGAFYSQKRVILKQELGDLQQLALQLREQRQLQGQDAAISLEEVEAQRRLAAQKVIPILELKREESKNIARQLAYQQTAATLLNNISSQRAKQKELLELSKQVAEGRDQFLQALNTLQSAAAAWQAQYVLSAPVGGKVYFSGIIQENQYVNIGQELFKVAPPSTGYVGELRIPQQSAGKVSLGQTVLVKFTGFPYQEYGVVRGHITAVADIAYKDSVFLAKVTLPVGLKTTYGKTLSYKTGMTASADVLTTNSRLLEKLFYKLRGI